MAPDGSDDEEEDDDEVSFVVPPELFAIADALAEQNAELARRMADLMRPSLLPLQESFQRIASEMSAQILPPEQMEALSRQIRGSLLPTIQSDQWRAMAERLSDFRIPKAGDLVSGDAEPPSAAEEEVLEQTADELADAGVTPADLDRFAVLVFLLRMMAYGGIAAGGFVTGGAGWMASLGALERFLSGLAKLRAELARRTEP